MTTAAAPTPVPVTISATRANAGLVVAASAMLLVSFVQTATNLAVPVLENEFPGVPRSTISWVVSGFNVTQVTFMLLGGRLADRMGRKRIFGFGMILFAVGAVLSGVASQIVTVIAARVVQAIGAALVLPASLTAILPAFPRERHATVVSLWSSMGILGATAAPTVAAFVIEVSSWRVVFLLAAPIAIAAFVAGSWALPTLPPPAKAAHLDVIGTVAGTTAVGGLVLAIVQGRAWGWTDPIILSVATLAAVNFAVFVVSSIVHPEPLVDFALLRVRSFSVVTTASALLSVATTASWFLYPLFLINIWGYSSFGVGLAMTPGPAAMVVASLFAGRLADRRGYKRFLIFGAVCATLGVAWMAVWLDPGQGFVFSFLPGTLAIGFGMAFMMGPGNSAALRDITEHQLGAANALYNTCRLFAGTLGIAGAAAVLGDSRDPVALMSSFRLAWWLLVAIMAVSIPVLAFGYVADGKSRDRGVFGVDLSPAARSVTSDPAMASTHG